MYLIFVVFNLQLYLLMPLSLPSKACCAIIFSLSTLSLKAETIYSATHINITGVFTAIATLFTTTR